MRMTDVLFGVNRNERTTDIGLLGVFPGGRVTALRRTLLAHATRRFGTDHAAGAIVVTPVRR